MVDSHIYLHFRRGVSRGRDGQSEDRVRLRHLRPGVQGRLPVLLQLWFEDGGVNRLLVAPRRLGLLRLLERELTEPSREAGGTETVLPRAAHSSIETSERTHDDPEALSNEGVRCLSVLCDECGVVALFARILTLSFQADPLAHQRSDDHLEALPGRGALRAPHQSVHAQPQEQDRDH